MCCTAVQSTPRPRPLPILRNLDRVRKVIQSGTTPLSYYKSDKYFHFCARCNPTWFCVKVKSITNEKNLSRIFWIHACRGVRYAKSLSIQYFIYINILRNSFIDIDIFKKVHIDINIDIDIFINCLVDIDIDSGISLRITLVRAVGRADIGVIGEK